MPMSPVCQKLRDAVDAYSQFLHEDGPRSHLGASQIGDPCRQKLWLGFRNCDYKVHTGRMQRLFNRGHKEEPRVRDYLEGAGIKFQTLLEFYNWKTEQHQFSSGMGHFGGSCDGIVTMPTGVGVKGNLVWECKTYGKATEFKGLFETGVQSVKPIHYAQMVLYCHKFNCNHALYTAVLKSNDEIYYEILPANPEFAMQLEDKSLEIITSQQSLPKLGASAAYYKCKFCDFSGVCHGGKEVLRSCRSCQNARAVDNGQWECSLYGIIPKEHCMKPTQCGQWVSILQR